MDKAGNRGREIKKPEYLPTYVSDFDKMIEAGGIERGSTILLSGGCGSGKSMFATQSAYNAAKRGEKVVYFSFDEDPEVIKRRVYNSFGWDLYALESEGKLFMQKVDPYDISRSIERIVRGRVLDSVVKSVGHTPPPSEEVTMPFHPDRVIIDSLSALSIASSDEQKYRAYLKVLFDSLRSYNSVNMVITETEQVPERYSRSGIEEFLVDGVVVFYNIRREAVRTRAIEILKLRFSDHMKKLVPFKITDRGIVVYLEEQVF